MIRNLSYDFAVDNTSKTIKIKKEYAANVKLVWQSWTTKEGLDQWWGPKPWHVETKTLYFILNGIWLYAMVSPEGEKHWCLSQFLEIEEEKTFTQRKVFCDEDGVMNPELPQSTWKVTFTPVDEHTLVDCLITFDSEEELNATLEMGFKEVITVCLTHLEELLERTTQ